MRDLHDPSGPRDQTDHAAGDFRRLHSIRNQLSIIVGFCDLLLNDVPSSDRRHADLLEIKKAADTAMSLLEERRDTL